MIIGEAGANEMKKVYLLWANSALLDEMLAAIDLDEKMHAISNIINYRPPTIEDQQIKKLKDIYHSSLDISKLLTQKFWYYSEVQQ